MSRVCAIALILSVPILTIAKAPDGAGTEAWSFLRKATVDSNPEHRREALSALSSIDGADQTAVQLVAHVLTMDNDSLVRQTAAGALGVMKAKQAVPALQMALDDPSGEVAYEAAESLCKMGDKSGVTVLKEVLAGNVRTSPNMVTSAVRDAKHKLRHPQIIFWMGAQDATGAFFGPAAMGMGVAKDAFSDSGASGRAGAVTALVKDSDPYALTLIEWALSDDSWGVRLAAAKALGERGNDQSIPKLQFLMDDPHFSVDCMAAASIIHIEDRDRGVPDEAAEAADPPNPLLKK